MGVVVNSVEQLVYAFVVFCDSEKILPYYYHEIDCFTSLFFNPLASIDKCVNPWRNFVVAMAVGIESALPREYGAFEGGASLRGDDRQPMLYLLQLHASRWDCRISRVVVLGHNVVFVKRFGQVEASFAVSNPYTEL